MIVVINSAQRVHFTILNYLKKSVKLQNINIIEIAAVIRIAGIKFCHFGDKILIEEMIRKTEDQRKMADKIENKIISNLRHCEVKEMTRKLK